MGEDRNWTDKRGRTLSRRRLLQGAAVGGVGFSTAFLAACGGSNNNNKVASATRSPATQAAAGGATAAATRAAAGGATATAGAAAGPLPKRGGSYAVLQSAEPPSFDVHTVTTQTLLGVGPGMVYSRLLRLQLGPDALQKLNAIPVGDLAEKWENPSPTTYTFSLRKGVKFFNIAPVNGRELTAQDVVYSFGRQRDLKTNAVYQGPIKSVTAPDQYTVQIELTQPNSDQLIDLAASQNKVVAHERVEATGDLKDLPLIGSGAWMFDEKAYVKNSVHAYVPNPNYYINGADGKPYPYVSSFQALLIPDQSTQIAAFRTKKFTAITASSKKDLDGYVKDLPGANVVPRRRWVTDAFWVQTQSGPTKDMRVRQALSKAINRQEIRDTVYFGSGFMSPEVLLPGQDYILPDAELSKLLAFDPAAAKQLLSAAGVSNWQPKLLVANTGFTPAVGELMQAQLKQVGITASIESIDIPRFTETVLAKGEFELCVFTTSPGSSTNADLKSRWATGGGRNAGRLSVPALDALIDQQSQNADKNSRLKQLQDVQRMIIDQASIIPNTGVFTWDVAHPFFKDWAQTSPDYYEYTNYQVPWLDQ